MSSDAGLGSKEDDARLNERIYKARSELSELHKIIAKDDCDCLFRKSDGPASHTRSRSSNAKQDAKRSPPVDIGDETLHMPRSSSSERLMQIPRSGETAHSERMRMAELSDEQLTWPSSDNEAPALATGNLSSMYPIRNEKLPRRTTAKNLRDYSYVQQALSFDNVTDDDEGEAVLPNPSTARSVIQLSTDTKHKFAGVYGKGRTPEDLQTYVRHMEETIAQLVQQKDELVRNQATFDQQASDMFPSLENLNHQLSQIVQGKLLQSNHSQSNDDVATMHEDMLDELRVQREQLSEFEADSKRRKYDAELQEQERAIEVSQIRADIISVVANEKMRDERAELMVDTIKKLQQEVQEAVENMVQRYQSLDKRINQLQPSMTQPRLVGHMSQRRWMLFVFSLLMVIMSLTLGTFVMNSEDCGLIQRCRPLI